MASFGVVPKSNYTVVVRYELMARPKTINPKGKTRRLSVVVSEPMVKELEREAKRQGVTLGAIVRELLSRGAA